MISPHYSTINNSRPQILHESLPKFGILLNCIAPYTVSGKKEATVFLGITLTNLDAVW